MTHQSPFVLMRGMDILAYLRDSAADEAERKRTFIQQCEEIVGGSTNESDRQRVRALQGAADALTFIIGIGQDARLRSEAARRPNEVDQKLLEIITRCANQARVALIEAVPELDELEKKENLINLG